MVLIAIACDGREGKTWGRGEASGNILEPCVESMFSEIFSIYSTLSAIFKPLVGKVCPCRKIFGATPAFRKLPKVTAGALVKCYIASVPNLEICPL